ncbi:hypothetical protein HJC99_04675 [Candidatus Saccharibacteria bacterium]|nr:hypothetical protein [Candidatus Saccharibacteria bacterium]
MRTRIVLEVKPDDTDAVTQILLSDPRLVLTANGSNRYFAAVDDRVMAFSSAGPKPKLDPDMPLLDLSRQLQGEELTAVCPLKEHLWINSLADCALITRKELSDIRGLGVNRVNIILGLLSRAGVELGSAAGNRADWFTYPTINGAIYVPLDQFRAITLTRACNDMFRIKHPRIDISRRKLELLKACGLAQLGDLIGYTPQSIAVHLRQLRNGGHQLSTGDTEVLTALAGALIRHYNLSH